MRGCADGARHSAGQSTARRRRMANVACPPDRPSKEDAMYGTIARMRVKDGAEAELKRLTEQFQTLNIPGYVGEYVFRMDADPNEWFLVALFRDKDSYRANAESPE